MKDYAEIDGILEFFTKNKASLVKLSYQIDFKRHAHQTDFDGYM